MAEIDDELVARAIRWCAEAGRQAGATEVRAALSPLSWDQLLAARALLADLPPVRPLGPNALADMARGAAADVAAERERGGQYRPDPDEARPAARPRGRAAARVRRPATPLIRRARDRVLPAEAAPPRLPPLDLLHAPEGRAVLEGLLRRHGARAAVLGAELARGWVRADGAAPGEDDLRALLDHHGLARGFESRERSAALHALRAAGGLLSRAAPELGLDAAGLRRLLERLGAAGEAEAVREDRRRVLRQRATLAERVRLLLGEAERLEDLGLLAEIEADLKARLPDHLRALRAANRAPPPAALAASLSLTPEEVRTLAGRFALDLSAAPPAPGAPRPPRPLRPPRPGTAGTRPRRPAGTPPRPGKSGRSGPARAAPPRPSGGSSAPRRPARRRQPQE